MSLEEQEKIVEKKINEIVKKFDSKINSLIRGFAFGSGLEINKDLAVLNKEVLKELFMVLTSHSVNRLYMTMGLI